MNTTATPRFTLFAFLSLCLAALVTGCLSSSPDAASKAARVSLSEPLHEWLASAGPQDQFKTIITFHNRDGFQRLEQSGIRARRLKQLPIAFARLTPEQIRGLMRAPEVRSLWHEQRMDLLLDESVALTRADRIINKDGSAKYTGSGISVAVIDTGVDGAHPDLPAGSKMEGYANFGDPDVFDEGDPALDVLAPAPTGDTYGHGTHVSSIVGGLGVAATGIDGDEDGDADRFTGMAPGAKIFSFKTDAGAFLFGGWILASFDWILDYNADPANVQKIRVSTNSWGCCDGRDYNPDDPINVAIKALYDANVVVIFAAGNGGEPNSLNHYATSPWAVSVAAGNKNLELSSFSSRGRIGDNWNRELAQSEGVGVYRPTLIAPGEDITAAKSSHATVMALGTDPVNPMYTSASGTSMAAPHVAGAVALMLEARPGLRPQHVIDILENTATTLSDYEWFETGIGHLNALTAVQAAEKGKVHFAPLIHGPSAPFQLIGSTPVSGTANPNTWAIRPESGDCASLDSEKSNPLHSFHTFQVGKGTDAVYAEIEWADATQLIYLVLYDTECKEAAVSAGLLDIGDVKHRALVVTSPTPGTWTMAVYGRINLPTPYTGAYSTYDKRGK